MKAWAVVSVLLCAGAIAEAVATNAYDYRPHEKTAVDGGGIQSDGYWYLELPSHKKIRFEGATWSPEWRITRQYVRAIVCRDYPADADAMGLVCETVFDPVSQSAMNWMFGIGRWAHLFGTDEVAKWAGRHFTASAIAEMDRSGIQSIGEAFGVVARRLPMTLLTSLVLGTIGLIRLIGRSTRTKSAELGTDRAS